MFSGVRDSTVLHATPPEVDFSYKSKMAIAKPEMLLFQRRDELETKFQRLLYTHAPNRLYFYLSLGMILFDQMLPNQRRRRWCYLLSVDFTALHGYHNLLYLYMYIFLYFNICISGLAAAILDFPMHSNTNSKDISTSESAIPQNRAMTGKLQLVDSVPSKMVRISVFWPPSYWICSWKQLSAIEQLSRAPQKTWVYGISFLAYRYAGIKVFPVWRPSSWIFSRTHLPNMSVHWTAWTSAFYATARVQPPVNVIITHPFDTFVLTVTQKLCLRSCSDSFFACKNIVEPSPWYLGKWRQRLLVGGESHATSGVPTGWKVQTQPERCAVNYIRKYRDNTATEFACCEEWRDVHSIIQLEKHSVEVHNSRRPLVRETLTLTYDLY